MPLSYQGRIRCRLAVTGEKKQTRTKTSTVVHTSHASEDCRKQSKHDSRTACAWCFLISFPTLRFMEDRSRSAMAVMVNERSMRAAAEFNVHVQQGTQEPGEGGGKRRKERKDMKETKDEAEGSLPSTTATSEVRSPVSFLSVSTVVPGLRGMVCLHEHEDSGEPTKQFASVQSSMHASMHIYDVVVLL